MDTTFVFSGEACVSGLINWEVRFPEGSTGLPGSEGTDVLIFGTAEVVDGAWQVEFGLLSDMIGPGPGGYIFEADCLSTVRYAPTT